MSKEVTFIMIQKCFMIVLFEALWIPSYDSKVLYDCAVWSIMNSIIFALCTGLLQYWFFATSLACYARRELSCTLWRVMHRRKHCARTGESVTHAEKCYAHREESRTDESVTHMSLHSSPQPVCALSRLIMLSIADAAANIEPRTMQHPYK